MSLGGAVLELYAKLGLDSSEYKSGLEDAKGKANGFASFLGTLGKVGVATFTAIGGATVAMSKQAIDAYSNFEQLEGGIRKLYGEESMSAVMQYAEQAFMTSGKSMNEYMNSVSQITASLKRSIGDDMDEVARMADIAMTLISDNVNTFGSDAEFVENAIMGLSRNNYTMIDNLKLGYAGTAQGMLELINDSGVLGKKLTDTSQLANVGFDKMILAIQKIQEEQGIAGTTANEAMTTIEGSAKATKAAWENVITAIGKGEGLSDALGGLQKALFGENEGEGLISQYSKVLKQTMEGIGEFVVESAPLIVEKVPEILSAIVPSFVKTVSSITKKIGSFIFGKIPEFLNMGVEMINGISEGLVEGVPSLLENALPIILSFAESLRENIGLIVDAGMNLLINLAQGIVNALPSLIAYVPLIITNIAGIINDNMPKIFSTAVSIIVMLGKGIIDSIPIIVNNFGNIVEAIFSVIQAVNWIDLGGKVVKLIADGVKALFNVPIDIFKNIGKGIFDTFKNGFSWSGLGKSIVDGIVNGIKNFGGAIKESLLGMAHNAWNGVKNFFGIKSPSKLMRDTIGKFIPLGIAEGIEDTADSVYKAMDNLNGGTVKAYDSVFGDIPSKDNPSGEAGLNYGGVVINVYASEGMDENALAERIMRKINTNLKKEQMIYG